MDFKKKLINYSNIPFWNNGYIYSFDEINYQNLEIKDFYFEIFYKQFIKFKLINLQGSDNYIFILFFHLKKRFQNNELEELEYIKYCLLIYNNYPIIESYINNTDLPYLLAKHSFTGDSFKMILKSGIYINNFSALFEIQCQTGNNTITKEIIVKLINKENYTKLGLNNFDQIFEILLDKIKFKISRLKSINAKNITFWDLFIDISATDIKPYQDKYYQVFFKKKRNYYEANKGNKAIFSNWIYEDGISQYIVKGIKLHPLDHYLIYKSILSFLNNEFRDCENEFRVKNGFPKIGEGNLKWKSENELFMLLKSKFSQEKVEQQASPIWLNNQHLDIYFPEWNIAVEYQGLQHYKPIDFFGGQEAFDKNIERDERKRTLCQENKCNLIYVRKGYDIKEVINEVRKIIKLSNKIIINNYSIKKVTQKSNIVELKANREVYDCKTRKTISFEEFKKNNPKVQFENFINRKSIYKRYILKSELYNSNTPSAWKTIKNIKTGEIFRFNKTEFAKHAKVSTNNVWNFFKGKQKLFHYTYKILND